MPKPDRKPTTPKRLTIMAKRTSTTNRPLRWPEEAAARKQVAKQTRLAPPIRQRIEAALRHEGFLSESEAKEAAFHLTDWIADLADINELFAKRRWNAAQAQKTLMAFVAHAPDHLAAAHRILYGDPLTDVFEIGAVKGSGRAKRQPGAPYPDSNGPSPRRKVK